MKKEIITDQWLARDFTESKASHFHRYCHVLAAVVLLCTTACSYRTAQGKTKVLDASTQDTLGGTGTSSADIRVMADRMARAVSAIQVPEGSAQPRINLLPIANRTRFRMDAGVLRNKLMKELVNRTQGKFVFMARDSEQEVLQERAKKREGLYDALSTNQTLLGADYLLKGEMRALSKASGQGVSDYIVYSFSLINAETTQIVWMDDYETKKQSSVGVVYQ